MTNDDDINDLINDEPPNKKQKINKMNVSFSIDWFGGSDKGKKPHMEDRRIAISDLSSKFKHSFTSKNKYV